MSAHEQLSPPSFAGSDGAEPRPSVELVSGRLTEEEIAAISVAVAAMSAISREEAHQREIAERTGGSSSAWNSPVRTHRSAHSLRANAGQSSWIFSQR
ncbi:acyl-CoA carboxylase epsilon subunit [Dermabacter sp. HMSC08H10]|uniref:acyl-CoA carboxylase epsilon subunit n=1 Tax=Dermabacter sp. HMSC08H10 TaxID=1581144 RepID=UPI0008A317B9|nr:hypothetical protein HMPREF3176_02835 [Dermabacter sp. HMSC08H10]